MIRAEIRSPKLVRAVEDATATMWRPGCAKGRCAGHRVDHVWEMEDKSDPL